MNSDNQIQNAPRLFGMITTAASARYTAEALRTFFLYTEFRDTDNFILIDNDGAWAQNKAFTHPAIELKINPEEHGFAENANQLIRSAIENRQDLFLLNNDLIFTNQWHVPMDNAGESISCPLSNREVQYSFAIKVTKVESPARLFNSEFKMNLDSYSGFEFATQAIAEAHRANNNNGLISVLVMPFFCVRIPLKILEAVGLFDEDYGRGGGEDYDYSLRAYLSGFPTRHALGSWIIHFYGKSSWDGVEDQAQRSDREEKMIAYFEKKWGKVLKEIVFNDRSDLIQEYGLQIPDNNQGFADIIRTLRLK